MSDSKKLVHSDAISHAELVKNGEYTSEEMVEIYIENIEKLNPKLNAVISKTYENARSITSNKNPEAPFYGVPTLIKDNVDVAGSSTTNASKLLVDYIPTEDSEIVKRIKKAGFIILGRTNMPEFGILCTTEPNLYGPTHNPWDPTKTPGGSSGGAAAAVASNMIPIAHGNDGGGSIRIPSSCCGLFGLKPSRGRNPHSVEWGEIGNKLAVNHMITKSVRDSAALLDLLSGPTHGQLYNTSPPKNTFLKEAGTSPGKLSIAYMDESFRGGPVDPICVNIVQETADLCIELGHKVNYVKPPLDDRKYSRPFNILWALMFYSLLEQLSNQLDVQIDTDIVEPQTFGMYSSGKRIKALDYLNATQQLQETTKTFSLFMKDYDLLLTPTLAEPPAPLGSFKSTVEEPMKGPLRCALFTPFTSFVNALGVPAISVPLHWSNDRLPLGSQFIGKYGDEATLLRLGSQLEKTKPWIGERPQISI
jgi:amidase